MNEPVPVVNNKGYWLTMNWFRLEASVVAWMQIHPEPGCVWWEVVMALLLLMGEYHADCRTIQCD
jgi:succinate dehydrogenase hydrophobic anchor subunit